LQKTITAAELIGQIEIINDRISVFFIDIDEMKIFNDLNSRLKGDQVLCLLQQQLSEYNGKDAYLGSDEYIVILDNMGLSKCTNVANEIRELSVYPSLTVVYTNNVSGRYIKQTIVKLKKGMSKVKQQQNNIIAYIK
jgi:diguanylate cyclase (GGDEF)-like protein|tara:strand:+ start:343 stop:753 length:411 start_codon:yes stop_codon:yes gene_type:complete